MIQIPSDSYLRHWITQFEHTELWPSWRVATGLAVIGAVLERNIMFSYGQAGSIWPNTSVMLIGRSGDGKDTMISAASKVLKLVNANFIAGTTIEGVHESLFRISSNPSECAVGYILAPELSKFIGTKDYQEGIIAGITDLLSNNAFVDVTTKTDLVTRGRPKLVYNPTLTMFAGTTPDWLPEDCIGGGFLGRFVVAPELGVKPLHTLVPNPGKYESREQQERIETAKNTFLSSVIETKAKYPRGPVHVFYEDLDGETFFNDWYINRRRHFSANLEAFAARSGNLMRKIAMLMAVSREKSYISEVDYQFAAGLIEHSAAHLERGVIPSAKEVGISYVILDMLPATRSELIKELSNKHTSLWVKRALLYLLDTDQVIERSGVVQIKGAQTSQEINGTDKPTMA